MPKIRPRTAKKLASVPGRPAKPGSKLRGRSRRVPAEIGEIVRKRAEAETIARGDRYPAAGHRVPRRRGTLHSLEQEIRRDLQSQLGPVRAGRETAGHHPRRRRARRLSRSDRPRGRVDRRAAQEALSARRTPRADPERRPLHPDRGAADRGRRHHRPTATPCP